MPPLCPLRDIMQIDNDASDAIFNAILASDAPPSAKEFASELVDVWVNEAVPEDAANSVTVGVECGFWIRLDQTTFIVGAADRIAEDDDGIFAQEHKSTAKRSSYWNAEKWYDEISRAHQVATYASALRSGTWLIPTETVTEDGATLRSFDLRNFRVAEPRILVRAVSKGRPPELWPTAKGAFITINERRMEATLAAYRVVAEQIRAARRLTLTPWSLPGRQCVRFNKYKCRFYESCHKYEVAETSAVRVGVNLSPGSSAVLDYLIACNVIDVRDVNVVILSASTFGTWQQCAEEYRRDASGAKEEENENLQIGSVLHNALGVAYGTMKRRKD
jgi:hypothetical protein